MGNQFERGEGYARTWFKGPDLNPIEKMWSRVKSIRNKLRIKDMDELLKIHCDNLFGI